MDPAHFPGHTGMALARQIGINATLNTQNSTLNVEVKRGRIPGCFSISFKVER
jgi:hypothetical protein